MALQQCHVIGADAADVAADGLQVAGPVAMLWWYAGWSQGCIICVGGLALSFLHSYLYD